NGQGYPALDEREVDELPAAGPLACDERGGDRERSVERGGKVDRRDSDLHRRPASLAGDAHEAALGLQDEIETRALAVRAGAAESGDRAVDEPRMRRREGVV